MAATSAGSRIVVKGGTAPLILRALRSIELDGDWAIPVMADLAAMEQAGITTGPVEIEVSTDTGVIHLSAEIDCAAGVLAVRATGLRVAALTEQRRENVRATVVLAVRGTILSPGQPSSARTGPADSAGPADSPGSAGPSRAGGASVVLEGTTRSVSAGGLCVLFGALAAGVQDGARIYLELTMPGGDLAPAIVTLIDRQPVTGGVLARLEFADISPLDRERLVRMVFARQRADLAERRGMIRPL